MKIIGKGTMPDGTVIQIEEWNEDYSFMPYGNTLTSYPKSKANHKGSFEPKLDETYRFHFRFDSYSETQVAFDNLISGKNVLSDYKERFSSNLKYLNCI